MNPLVSIIVPVYKVEEYLDECIESLVNQTYHNIEIILVDDGSPDNCPKMCDNWASKDDRIKVIHKENGGLSDARNAALNVVSGKYLIFVDSDDIVTNDIIESYVIIAEKESVDAVLGEHFVSFHDGDIPNIKEDNGYEVISSEELLVDVFTRTTRWEACNILFATEKFSKQFRVGFLYEDFDLIPKVIIGLHQVAISHSSKYYYRTRSGSIMHSANPIKKDLAIIAKENIKMVKNSNISDHNKELIIFGILSEVSSRIKYCKMNNLTNKASDFMNAGKNLILKNTFSILNARINIKRKLIIFYEAFF